MLSGELPSRAGAQNKMYKSLNRRTVPHNVFDVIRLASARKRLNGLRSEKNNCNSNTGVVIRAIGQYVVDMSLGVFAPKLFRLKKLPKTGQ